MRVLTEADLRAGKVCVVDGVVHVKEGTFVTPTAKEYMKDRGISLVTDKAVSYASMPYTPIMQCGKGTYVNAVTGEGYEKKPEEMTHLRGNLLVPKSHPRIALRGKLDTLQSWILLMETRNTKRKLFCADLESLLAYIRAILSAEVKEEPLGELLLFGLRQEELRTMSHQVKEYFGIQHSVPEASMGETALELNFLRTQAREVELCAAAAFGDEDSLGIIQHLNRLSSGIYILFCREISGYYRN